MAGWRAAGHPDPADQPVSRWPALCLNDVKRTVDPRLHLSMSSLARLIKGRSLANPKVWEVALL
jgi:hypothetical protein